MKTNFSRPESISSNIGKCVKITKFNYYKWFFVFNTIVKLIFNIFYSVNIQLALCHFTILQIIFFFKFFFSLLSLSPSLAHSVAGLTLPPYFSETQPESSTHFVSVVFNRKLSEIHRPRERERIRRERKIPKLRCGLGPPSVYDGQRLWWRTRDPAPAMENE